MLTFEPVKKRETIPLGVIKIVEALEKRGFPHSYTSDLELINLGRTTPLIECDGKFFYQGVVVGYLRAGL